MHTINATVSPESAGANLLYVCPDNTAYGVGITLRRSSVSVSVVIGNFDGTSDLNVLPNIGDLPPLIMSYYSSILSYIGGVAASDEPVSRATFVADTFRCEKFLRYRDSNVT